MKLTPTYGHILRGPSLRSGTARHRAASSLRSAAALLKAGAQLIAEPLGRHQSREYRGARIARNRTWRRAAPPRENTPWVQLGAASASPGSHAAGMRATVVPGAAWASALAATGRPGGRGGWVENSPCAAQQRGDADGNKNAKGAVPHCVRARATARGFLAALGRRAIERRAAAYRGAVGRTGTDHRPRARGMKE